MINQACMTVAVTIKPTLNQNRFNNNNNNNNNFNNNNKSNNFSSNPQFAKCNEILIKLWTPNQTVNLFLAHMLCCRLNTAFNGFTLLPSMCASKLTNWPLCCDVFVLYLFYLSAAIACVRVCNDFGNVCMRLLLCLAFCCDVCVWNQSLMIHISVTFDPHRI